MTDDGVSGAAPSTVLVVGDVIDDLIVRPLRAIERGSDTPSQILPRPGGSGANQAVWLAAHGADVRFAGRVATRDLARHLEVFRAAGVDAWLAGDPELPTGTIVVLVDPVDGERTMFTDRGANLRLGVADLPDDLLDGVALLHVSGYSLFEPEPRAAVLDLVARARTRGVPFSVDPASVGFLREVGARAFLRWLDGTALLLPNLDEGRLLTGASEPDAVVEVLLEHADEVVLTLGQAGALLADRRGTRLLVEGDRVEVVDTTGAGDAFCGGYLAAWVRGERGEGPLRAGVAAGTRAVGHPGARPVAAGGRRGLP